MAGIIRHLAIHAVIASLLLIAITPPAPAEDKSDADVHIVEPGSTEYIPVTKDVMWQRISDAAKEYEQYAPVARIAFFDISFPATVQEYEELNGYAVLLVTAVTQEPSELPLRRVFAVLDEDVLELPKLGIIRSVIPADRADVLKTLGPYREDSIYLFPMFLRAMPAKLVMDFAENRDGFVLGEFPIEQDEFPVDFREGLPSEEALGRIITREIPFFAQ